MPFVNGVYMAVPGVDVTFNNTATVGPAQISPVGAMFLGPSDDGEPNTILDVSTLSTAQQALKGGDGLQAATFAINNGAQTVYFIRTDTATQSTLTLDGTTAASIILTTTSYGDPSIQAFASVADGSAQGFAFTQGLSYLGAGGTAYPTVTKDNIALFPLSLAYTGAGTTPTYTVSDTTLTASTSAGGNIATITFTPTMTVTSLVQQLNAVETLTAVVTDPNPNDLVSGLFDSVTAGTLSISATVPTQLTANATAVTNYINTAAIYFTGVRQTNPTSLAIVGTTYATGGTVTPATTQQWQSGYTLAQATNAVQLISCVSSDSTTWAMNDAHCQYMESIGLPRRGYLGGASGLTLAQQLTSASALNSNRSTLIWPEQQEVLISGQQGLTAPYLLAAIATGLRAGTQLSQALTQQPFTSFGAGQQVTVAMAGQGIDGGVAVLYPNQTGNIVLAQDRTTWLQNDSEYMIENSSGLIIDMIVTNINQSLVQFIGQPADPTTVGTAAQTVLEALMDYYNMGWLMAQPVASDIALIATGDVISGTFQAAIDVPTNYITAQLTPIGS